MSLAILYCKEIAKELRQIPVYRPGTSIAIGDIIRFNSRKPIGDFIKVGNLTDYSINLPREVEQDNELDSYIFGSSGSVSTSFEAVANAGEIGKGKLTIGFKKEGAIYLSAIDCKETRFSSIITLEDRLAEYKEKLDWNNHFIVISVTVAAKALIMQSSSSSASLEIEGEVRQLSPDNTVLRNLDANLSLSIRKYNEASFIKDWSNNVPVFFKLIQYKRRFLGSWGLRTRSKRFAHSTADELFKHSTADVAESDQFVITETSFQDLSE